MNLEINERKNDQLMSRERITAFVEYEHSTPSRIELKKALAKKLNADESLLVIRHIYPRFGLKKSKIIAHLYKDSKKMLLFKGKRLIEKNTEKKQEEGNEKEENPDSKAKENAEENKEGEEQKPEEKPEENKEEKKE